MNLLRTLISVSFVTLLSRIVGFLRDMLLARFFGAGIATDAFFVAFRLPNLLRRIFAEGAFSQAFVPILTEHRHHHSHAQTQLFVANITGILLLALVIVVLLGVVFAGSVVAITAPGFVANSIKFKLTVLMLKITMPYILFISLASLIGGVLNCYRNFVIPAFTPTLLNLVFITFTYFWRQHFTPPVLALAWAVFVGGILQLAFQLPYLAKIGFKLKLNFNWRDPYVWRVIKLMLPAIFAMSIAQISLVINTIFASFLPTGSVSWLYYADRLMEFPTGVLGVALGTILLPNLAQSAITQNTVEFSRILEWGLRLCLVLAVPATVGLAIVAKPLVMTLFMYGKFNMIDVQMTALAFMAYCVGLLGLILVKIFAPGFFANQDIKTPVIVGLVVLVATQVMNLIFVPHFKHAGLALSIGLGAIINAFCLYLILRKRGLYVPQANLLRTFLAKIIAAVGVMAVLLVALQYFLPLNFTAPVLLRVCTLLVLVVPAIIVYFASLYILGLRWQDFNYSAISNSP